MMQKVEEQRGQKEWERLENELGCQVLFYAHKILEITAEIGLSFPFNMEYLF